MKDYNRKEMETSNSEINTFASQMEEILNRKILHIPYLVLPMNQNMCG